VGNNVDIFSLCRMSPRAQARFIKSHTLRLQNTKQIPGRYHCLAENRHFLISMYSSVWVKEKEILCLF